VTANAKRKHDSVLQLRFWDMRTRGSYAKGVAKREEILSKALDVVAESGYHGPSVRDLADAVGLSQAGLLHYFDSKEELFTAILRTRDEHDLQMLDDGVLRPPRDDETPPSFNAARDAMLRIVRHNAQVPGVVELFSRVAVDAADPGHPAHAFFAERSSGLRDTFAQALRAEQEAGRIDDRLDPDALSRLVQAVADGLQLQWLLDPKVDMATTLDVLFDLIEPAPRSSPASAAEADVPSTTRRPADSTTNSRKEPA